MKREEKIARKIKNMLGYVDFLKKHSTSEKELLEDYLLKSAIERNLQLAIESALDIGEVIISSEDLEKPEDYRSIIIILGKEGIIPVQFAERFSEAAKLRNILVHMYTEIDPAMISQIMENNLDDFDKYAQYIARYIKFEK
ncbi:MAG: hypothetical protein A4E27_01120 [Methanobacterium sp. PtaU1.Bin242]|nr:MAG: hypothetical protein A4E27_01120 [Methanobacterium sp. PtaU1.Bin242]